MLKKISHIIIASLILISTTGFTINMHYCHDQLIDLALFSPAHSCCDAETGGQCHSDSDISKMNHCKDESIVAELTDDFVGSSYTFSLENTSSIDLLHTASILFNIQGSDNAMATTPPWHKEPPPYQEVVLSHIQAYLI
jgi:hypothetical protein